jgi:uncharacterized protein (TIGR03089 family)
VTPADLLATAASADPARPFVTFYDDATGERVELSVATFANWVAKTANLLQEELDASVGTTVRVALPAHWQAHVILMAAWQLGCTVLVPMGGSAEVSVDLAVVGPDGEPPDAAATLAVAMRPMGLGFPTPPPAPAVDYGSEVLSQGDVFLPWAPVPAPSVLLRHGSSGLAAEPLCEAARSTWGLSSGERLLTDEPAASLRGTLVIVAVLRAGGSLVLCRRLAPAQLPARQKAERVTRVATGQAPR